MRVDRCVCHGVSIQDILELARSEKLTPQQLEDRLICGTGCGICQPYVRRALRTGQTVFTQVVRDADEPNPPRLRQDA
jgi:bacterioferritin-associated ferredoxin